MTYRPHLKYASYDAHAGPWTTCSTCGLIWSQKDMQFQYDFRGGSVPINTGWLRCPKCITPLTYQQSLLIIPPDPPPFMNTRPEPYTVDETSWLTTEDGDIISTQNSDGFTSNIPNPSQNADLTNLVALISASGASVSVLYMDLFNGDPTAGGASVLALVTGSSTRTDISSNLTTVLGVAQNTAPIVVALASGATTNVTHVGFYSAATAGTLLISGTVSATYPTIVQGAAVQFDALGIQININ